MQSYWRYTPEEKADWVLEFTRIHESFAEGDIIGREAAILDHQLPAIFLPPEPGERITGRFRYPPLAFTPQPAGDRGGFAYVANPAAFKELIDSQSNPSIRLQLEAAAAYWENHDTGQQTRSFYPDHVAELLPSDNWTGEPGIGFPLLRMSGSQLDYGKLVELGLPGLEQGIRHRISEMPGEAHLFEGMLSALGSFKKVLLFYERELIDIALHARSHAEKLIAENLAHALSNLKAGAPKNLLEGIQLSYLYCLCAGSNNFGRMDDYLAPLYQRDLCAGMISHDEAVEMFSDLWKLVNFRGIIYDGRVIIGGRGRKHPEASDELALVIMDSVGVTADVLPQLTLRLNHGTDQRIKERAFDLFAAGNPYPMLYNDEVNIPSAMKAFGVEEKAAEDCIPFGCGEYVLYHKSFGTPSGVINLAKALEVVLHKGNDPIGLRPLGISEANKINIGTFDDLWKAYTITLEAYIDALAWQEKIEYEVAAEAAPFLFFSMLFDDCLARGKPVFAGGIRHLGGTLETYGNTNTADALLALKKVVFENKAYTLEEVVFAIDMNFKGHDTLRQALLSVPKYGNDDKEADEMLMKVHDHVCLYTKGKAKEVGLDSYLVVNINNSANTIFGKFTAASADGRLAGTSLANGNTPHMGMDTNGPTALLNSIAKPRTDIHAGASQNIKLTREMLTRYRKQTEALIQSYFISGGAQLMITAVNKGDLERAMTHPEEYPNLLVRVGGFSARFIELDPAIQLEIINRTLY